MRDARRTAHERARGSVLQTATVKGIAAAASECEVGAAGASRVAESVVKTKASPIDDRMRPRKVSEVQSLDVKMRRCLASRIGLGEWLSSCNLLGLSVSMLEEDVVHVNL